MDFVTNFKLSAEPRAKPSFSRKRAVLPVVGTRDWISTANVRPALVLTLIGNLAQSHMKF